MVMELYKCSFCGEWTEGKDEIKDGDKVYICCDKCYQEEVFKELESLGF
jgi:ribosomal protein L24E